MRPDSKTFTIVNKTLVDMHHQPIGYKFHKAMEVFIAEGTQLNTVGEITLTSMANNIINIFGVSLVSIDGEAVNSCSPRHLPPDVAEGPVYTSSGKNDRTHMHRNYSFMRDGNKDMGIDNPNIIDPDIDTLTPELTNATDKFLATNDPFYEQDDQEVNSDIKQISNRDRTERKKSIAIIPVANLMCAFCTIPTAKNYHNKYYNKNKLTTLQRDKG